MDYQCQQHRLHWLSAPQPVLLLLCCRRLQGAYQQVDGRWGGRFNKPVDATLSARDNVQAGRRPGDRENRRKLQATYTPAQLDKKASKAPVELRVSARSQDFGVRPRDELNDRRLQATYTEASARAPADARVTDSYNAPVDARVALRDTELGARLRDETKGGRKLQAPKKKGKDCTDAVACTGRKMLGYPGIHVLGRRDGRYAEDVAAVRAREKAQP